MWRGDRCRIGGVLRDQIGGACGAHAGDVAAGSWECDGIGECARRSGDGSLHDIAWRLLTGLIDDGRVLAARAYDQAITAKRGHSSNVAVIATDLEPRKIALTNRGRCDPAGRRRIGDDRRCDDSGHQPTVLDTNGGFVRTATNSSATRCCCSSLRAPKNGNANARAEMPSQIGNSPGR